MPNPPIETNRLRTLLTACMILLLIVGGTAPVVFTFAPGGTSHHGVATAQQSVTINVTVYNEAGNVVGNVSYEDDDPPTSSGFGYHTQAPSLTPNQLWDNATMGSGDGPLIDDFEDNDIDEYQFNHGDESTWFVVNDSEANPGTIEGDFSLASDDVNDNQMLWSESGLDNYPTASDSFSIQMTLDVSAGAADEAKTSVLWAVGGTDGNIQDGYGARLNDRNNEIEFIDLSGGINNIVDSTGFTPTDDVYTFVINAEGETIDPGVKGDSLELDVPDYMKHDTVSDYTVRVVTGGTDSEDVTDHSNTTVTSSNDTVVSVDEDGATLTSIADENVSERVTITANFTNSTGDNLTVSENVTVAQATMKNFDILPSAWRLNAMFSFGMGTGDSQQDTLPLWIFLTILVGVGLSALSTSFGGIGGMTMMMVVGWVAGYVGDGVMLATVFVGLFIGFNLAANIDYAVRRG